MSAIALSGIGILSPLGIGRTPHWDRLRAKESGLVALEPDPIAPLPLSRGGLIKSFQLAEFLPDRKLARMLSQATSYSFAAAQLALTDAGVSMQGIPPERRGLYCQTGMFQVEGRDLAPIVENCCEDGALSLAKFGDRGMSVINPFLPIRTLPNMGLGVLSIHFDLQGPNLVAGPFSAQGAMLLDLACSSLAEGIADICLVAGSDAPFNVMTLSSLLAMEGAPSELILGEAGVCLVLETEASVRARGGTIYALFESSTVQSGGRTRHGWNQEMSVPDQEPLGYLLGSGLLMETAHAALHLHASESLEAPQRATARVEDLSGAIGTVCLRKGTW